MYADDLVLSHGRVSVAKGTVTLSVGCRLNWYRALPVRRTIACSGPCGRRLAPRSQGPDERDSGAGTYIGGAYTAYRRCHLPATPGHADIGGTGRS